MATVNGTQEAQQRQTVSLVEILKQLIQQFPQRSQEIIWERFGIGGEKPLTLEEIGGKFSITRERVRQVIREVCRKVKSKGAKESLEKVGSEIIFTLDQNGGIIEEEKLLELLGDSNKEEKGAAKFFLECLDEVAEIEVKGEMKKSIMKPDFDLQFWKQVKNSVISILEKENSPLTKEELYEKTLNGTKQVQNKMDQKLLDNYLSVSSEIKINSFGKWGLSAWKEISPKGTRDKAYLVLKESGKPLHFKDIAREIDKHGLNKKKTHPQTVHNELIKDRKFILVGRGIYALSEWGYQKGTVKDVLMDVIKSNPGSFTKEEIIKEVLKVRQVKKSTIVINLNNYFKKNKEGKYVAK